MRCAECRRLNMRSESEVKRPMARAAFGVCSADKPWNYKSIFRDRDCESFDQAENEKVVAIFTYYKKERE